MVVALEACIEISNLLAKSNDSSKLSPAQAGSGSI